MLWGSPLGPIPLVPSSSREDFTLLRPRGGASGSRSGFRDPSGEQVEGTGRGKGIRVGYRKGSCRLLFFLSGRPFPVPVPVVDPPPHTHTRTLTRHFILLSAFERLVAFSRQVVHLARQVVGSLNLLSVYSRHDFSYAAAFSCHCHCLSSCLWLSWCFLSWWLWSFPSPSGDVPVVVVVVVVVILRLRLTWEVDDAVR